jgi:RNA polymerase sigma-70 factor (ECF subfamily)
VMRHLLGYTPGEIARLLEVPRGTVNSRLRRGLDELKGRL